jgi:hypothetical protein
MLCLDPDAAFAAVVDLARERGQAYPLTAKALYRRLKETKALARTDGRRATYPVTLEGVRRRVLHLPIATAFPDMDWVGSGPTDRIVPISCPDFLAAGGKSGQKTGPNSPQKVGFVPIVPISGAHAAHVADGAEREATDAVARGEESPGMPPASGEMVR